MNKTD